MDGKKFLPGNATIKTEPNTSNTSTAKKVFLSSSSFAQLAGKSVSNARLPSFKPPRDLLLTGSSTGQSNSTFNLSGNKSTRRTFVPNINVTRKKGSSSESATNNSVNDLNDKSKEKDKNKKPYNSRKRNSNFVQTQGVFSEGLAPGKVKAFGNSYERNYREGQILDKPKLNLDKKISKNDEDSKLKSILKDDFIDDPSQVPDISFIPSSLPMVYNVKKQKYSENLEKTFETLQVKTEKVRSVKIDELKNEKPDVTTVFESAKNPKLLLFEFPSLLQPKDEFTDKKKGSKAHSSEIEKQCYKPESLSSLGEGFLGYLRIHENGRAYFVFGKTSIPLCASRHGTRQEIMSTDLDVERSKGEVVSLGTVDASFTCSADFFQDIS